MRLMSAKSAAVRSWAGRPLRYCTVGVICASVSNGVIVGGDLAGFAYPILVAMALILTTPLGYIMHSQFTYGRALSIGRFARFVAGATGGSLLYVALMAGLCSGLRVPVWLASPTVTVIVLLWNVGTSRWAILHRATCGFRWVALGKRAVLPPGQRCESKQ